MHERARGAQLAHVRAPQTSSLHEDHGEVGVCDLDEPWLEPLTALAAEIGSTVTFEPIASGADGFYRPRTKAIVVEASHPANRQVKTLVHELAHALVRADRQDDDPELDAAAEELVAETTAYSVCASAGIDPGEYSITSLAGWRERTPIATIERTATLIDRLSRRIEDAVATVNLAEPDDAGGRAARANGELLSGNAERVAGVPATLSLARGVLHQRPRAVSTS